MRGVKQVVAASALWLLAATAWAEKAPQPPPEGSTVGVAMQRLIATESRAEQFSPRDVSTPGAGNRLSPEERRQLRRDVHDAGRALYSERGPHGGRREARGQ